MRQRPSSLSGSSARPIAWMALRSTRRSRSTARWPTMAPPQITGRRSATTAPPRITGLRFLTSHRPHPRLPRLPRLLPRPCLTTRAGLAPFLTTGAGLAPGRGPSCPSTKRCPAMPACPGGTSCTGRRSSFPRLWKTCPASARRPGSARSRTRCARSSPGTARAQRGISSSWSRGCASLSRRVPLRSGGCRPAAECSPGTRRASRRSVSRRSVSHLSVRSGHAQSVQEAASLGRSGRDGCERRVVGIGRPADRAGGADGAGRTGIRR